MGERWVTLLLIQDESLRCKSCYSALFNQKVHLYLDANDELDEVMCEVCFKKEQEGENE